MVQAVAKVREALAPVQDVVDTNGNKWAPLSAERATAPNWNPLASSDLKFRALEYVKNAYWAIVPCIEAISDPQFWGNHAPILNPHDRITCLTDDGRTRIECVVLSAGATWVQVVYRPSDVWELPEVIELAAKQSYKKICDPATSLWSVIRLSDGHVMRSDLPSADQCDLYIETAAR